MSALDAGSRRRGGGGHAQKPSFPIAVRAVYIFVSCVFNRASCFVRGNQERKKKSCPSPSASISPGLRLQISEDDSKDHQRSASPYIFGRSPRIYDSKTRFKTVAQSKSRRSSCTLSSLSWESEDLLGLCFRDVN